MTIYVFHDLLLTEPLSRRQCQPYLDRRTSSPTTISRWTPICSRHERLPHARSHHLHIGLSTLAQLYPTATTTTELFYPRLNSLSLIRTPSSITNHPLMYRWIRLGPQLLLLSLLSRPSRCKPNRAGRSRSRRRNQRLESEYDHKAITMC